MKGWLFIISYSSICVGIGIVLGILIQIARFQPTVRELKYTQENFSGYQTIYPARDSCYARWLNDKQLERERKAR